jgi:hypothetical protein
VPQYFFHVFDDQDTPDDEGSIFEDIAAARLWAMRAARNLMCETLTTDGTLVLNHRIEIEDEDHSVVDRVLFADAVHIIR